MKEVRRDFIHKTSPLRKALAIVTAAALVASMSNIQAFAAPADETSAADAKVTVRFEVEQGVTVRVGDHEFTHATENPVFEAKAAHDLTFTVEPAAVDQAAYMVGAVKYVLGDPRPQAVSADPEKAVQAEPKAAAASLDAASESQDAAESEAVEPLALQDVSVSDPAAVPEDEEMAEQSVPLPSPSTEMELPDEATPLAAVPPSSQKEAAASEDESLLQKTDGKYLLSKNVLSSAASDNKEVVVKVSSQVIEDAMVVSTWEDLKTCLEQEKPLTIEVADSFEATSTVEAKGKKSIELNGHTITAADSLKGESLFVVGDGVELSLTDEASKGVEPQPTAVEDTTNSEKPAEEDVAKLGSYDAEQRLLTYYVSASEINRAQGTTAEERTTMRVDLNFVGALEGSELSSLVKVEGGHFSMTGGRITNAQGAHGIEASGKATVAIAGGFVVGNGAQADGAGIYFKGNDRLSSTLTLKGDALVAGNMTSVGNGTSNNGAGLWASNCTLTVEGNAVVAGNYAGDEDLILDGSENGNGYISGSHLYRCAGGGIYIEANTTVSLGGHAVVTGNRAAGDGGGVYVKPTPALGSNDTAPANTFTLKDEAIVCNNASCRDMSAWNPKDHEATPDPSWFPVYAAGGGGIFSMGATHIDGGQIVNNYAADAGGGLMLPGEGNTREAVPDLFMTYGVVAGNYADGSEGGGIYCQPKKDFETDQGESYIKMGYITNNKTATEFDYGGGGLFIVSGGYLRVHAPLVTGNTADGWGGGVGACTNGTVITSDAAIFDNHANQVGHTTNGNEYGDAWAADQSYWYDSTFDAVTGDNALPAGASNDYFCAKQSVVYNDMLGGGYYNWKGFMSGRAHTSNKVHLNYAGWNQIAANVLTVESPASENDKVLAFCSAGFEKGGQAYVYLDSSITESEAKTMLLGALVSFSGSGYQKAYESNPSVMDMPWTGEIDSVKKDTADTFKTYTKFKFKVVPYEVSEGGALYKGDVSNPEQPTYTETLEGLSFYKTLTAKLKDSEKKYNVYEIKQFPQNGYAEAARFMALTSHPMMDPSKPETAEAAKQAAFEKATVFFTGNYSANNGGGIGCNGKIVIGRDPGKPEEPEEPKLPEDKFFDLTINKAWSNLGELNQEQNGTMTTAFVVRAYKNKNYYLLSQQEGSTIKPEFETVLGMTFDRESEDSQKRTLENLKEGWYVVIEEIGVAGDNFEVDSSTAQAVMDANTTVKFENTYTPEGSYSTGVVNSYAADDSAAATGGVRVDQDSVYAKRPHFVESNQPEAQNQTVTPQIDPVAAQAAN